MHLMPDPWWVPTALAAILFLDAIASIRPPAFIRECLDGVRFPRDWWWVLIVIKLLAVAGLVAGNWIPGVGLAANLGVVAYFVCAAVAHIKARFVGRSFWLNCCGMLLVSLAALTFAFFG